MPSSASLFAAFFFGKMWEYHDSAGCGSAVKADCPAVRGTASVCEAGIGLLPRKEPVTIKLGGIN